MPSERDQARDGLFARAPSTSPGSGTCRGAAATGHPAGTMVLVTFAETKVTRAGRAVTFDSSNAMWRGNRELNGPDGLQSRVQPTQSASVANIRQSDDGNCFACLTSIGVPSSTRLPSPPLVQSSSMDSSALT